MINTSKGCFALLNNIMCLTAPLIESRQSLFVQVGFIAKSLFYFDYFCGVFVGFSCGSALQQSWEGEAAAHGHGEGPLLAMKSQLLGLLRHLGMGQAQHGAIPPVLQLPGQCSGISCPQCPRASQLPWLSLSTPLL